MRGGRVLSALSGAGRITTLKATQEVGMSKRVKIVSAAVSALVLAAGGVGIAVATGDDEDDGRQQAITGGALERASEAALDHVGGGEVTETEAGDEESYYEVEVTRPDGGQVDVQLDRDFRVVGDAADDDAESGEDDD